MTKICPVCGGLYNSYYPMCYNCNTLKNEGKVIKCELCGSWHFSDKPCKCKTETSDKKSDEKKEKTETINIETDSKDDFLPFPEMEKSKDIIDITEKDCIICGDKSGKHLFCSSCYFKYKNKTLLLKITNCEKIELLDESYEGKYTCDDGHIVKSTQEVLIDNYLFHKNIAHAYEKALPIDKDKKHDLHPDFYLPKEDIYIEHWGMESNTKYEETKAYKIDLYKKAKITLIQTYPSDISDLNAALERKLKYYEENIIND